MRKNFLFPAIIAVTIIAMMAIFVVLIQAKNAPPSDSTMIFFYGETCPHCKNVEEFFAENKVREKISFEEREVYNSTANAKIMNDRYNKCGITDPKEMSVPLFWDGTACITGDQPIIDYFNNL